MIDPKNKIPKTKEELAHIRKLNRQRSARMEREITQKLNGRRTPMSGAGLVKGDGIIYLPDDQGICILECKVTSSVHELHGPQVPFKIEWITKLESDVSAMRLLGSRFGALILKFHGTSRVYVFLDTKYIPAVEQILDITIAQDNDMSLDLTTWANGREKKITHVYEKTLAAHVHGTVRTLHGTFYICTFTEFIKWFKKDIQLDT